MGPDLVGLAWRLGYEFHDPTLLLTALCHRSWCAEHPGHRSNERLEFLGDAVLGWVVAELAYMLHPDIAEGRLTDLRKSLVNASALAATAAELHLGSEMLLGKGEAAAGGRNKPSILSDALEAVIGAVHIDGGTEASRSLVERLLGERIALGFTGHADFKTVLQEEAMRIGAGAPVYTLVGEGPDHARRFFAEVRLTGDVVGRGEGLSKKQAEQAAAREAFFRISNDA